MLLQAPLAGTRSAMQRFLTEWLTQLRDMNATRVRWVIDVDPLDV
jgi:primosomal protein N'